MINSYKLAGNQCYFPQNDRQEDFLYEEKIYRYAFNRFTCCQLDRSSFCRRD